MCIRFYDCTRSIKNNFPSRERIYTENSINFTFNYIFFLTFRDPFSVNYLKSSMFMIE